MGNVNSAGLHQEVLRAFGPRPGPASAQWMRARVHELIDSVVEEGPPVDLRTRFAEPYSAGMVCEVLGLPHEHRQLGQGAMSTCVFLLHAVLTLVQHPETMQRLREQPDLMPRAVEELMGGTLSIGDGLPRIALADVQVGDVHVRAGATVRR
ncbi:hypothetical protein OG349_00175 [Streptomyces sp. NBC_01317]|uniref:hypothetical protein n=1 Tax=Streptomyces sp. NBC_01317 TaxID=2903822 RepID=UPI002E0E011F|nr:hypothetical protein OG349_00175 [Streptomyces sp. NBC_01317]